MQSLIFTNWMPLTVAKLRRAGDRHLQGEGRLFTANQCREPSPRKERTTLDRLIPSAKSTAKIAMSAFAN